MKKIIKDDCATGFQSREGFVVGLTKFEMACIHFMSASIAANDHCDPDWMVPEKARQHARSAVMLANALFDRLNRDTD